MKSLVTLIRLQKTYVDEQRLVLAQAQDRLDLIQRAIVELEAEQHREKNAVLKDPQNAITYGAFLKESIKRSRHLDRERQIAEAGVNAAREQLIQLFEEQKRYEIAESARAQVEAREELKREMSELDEIGGMTHTRKKQND